LPGKTRLRNDVLCIEWDIKPYLLTHLVMTCELLGVKTTSPTPPPPPAAAAAAEDGIRIDDSDVVLVGLAVSWENRDAYYIVLTDTAAKGL